MIQYRHITGEFNRKFPHCIWIDNTQPNLRQQRAAGIARTNSLGQAEAAGLVRVNYRGDLVLEDHLQHWMATSVQREYKLNGHYRTGMAILFSHKADAMLFKLQWAR